MKALAVIGGTGRGKTTFVKNLISKIKSQPIIYDVNNEYYKSGYQLPEIEDFIRTVENLEGKLIVFEEAKIFFSHHGKRTERIERLLIRKRHTKNFYIFVFHGLHQIPVGIIDYINTYVLFKTDENPNLVLSKFAKHERINNNYLEVLNHKDFHYYKEF